VTTPTRHRSTSTIFIIKELQEGPTMPNRVGTVRTSNPETRIDDERSISLSRMPVLQLAASNWSSESLGLDWNSPRADPVAVVSVKFWRTRRLSLRVGDGVGMPAI